MPVLKEAAVIAAGTIVDIEATQDFTTKATDGIKVLIATGDGHASVKLKNELAQALKPTLGGKVAWLIRPGANGGGDRDARTYTSFVRPAEPGDLDKIASLLANSSK